MRIVITGGEGQLGWELRRAMAPLGEIFALGRAEMDLEKPDRIRSVVRELKPDLIVNAGAYTQVDKAEEERDLAQSINGMGPGILAEEAKRIGAHLIHYSTDYVFDGLGQRPYGETDVLSPVNYYGASKLAGEQAIAAVGGSYLILRTSWIYGNRGQNFMLTILRLAREREELRVVNDQIGVPNWSRTIADTTQRIASMWNSRNRGSAGDIDGIFHLSAAGETSRYEFARAIVEEYQRTDRLRSGGRLRLKQIVPIATSEYPTAAARPRYSVLSGRKLREIFGVSLPEWRDQLKSAIEDSTG